MIQGRVNEFLEAKVLLTVRGPDGTELEFDVVIDTGFDGHLSLSPDVIDTLGLPWLTIAEAELADGQTILFDVHEGHVLWEGQPRRIPIDSAESEPLIGTALLKDHTFLAQFKPDGLVAIEPIA